MAQQSQNQGIQILGSSVTQQNVLKGSLNAFVQKTTEGKPKTPLINQDIYGANPSPKPVSRLADRIMKPVPLNTSMHKKTISSTFVNQPQPVTPIKTAASRAANDRNLSALRSA